MIKNECLWLDLVWWKKNITHRLLITLIKPTLANYWTLSWQKKFAPRSNGSALGRGWRHKARHTTRKRQQHLQRQSIDVSTQSSSLMASRSLWLTRKLIKKLDSNYALWGLDTLLAFPSSLWFSSFRRHSLPELFSLPEQIKIQRSLSHSAHDKTKSSAKSSFYYFKTLTVLIQLADGLCEHVSVNERASF